MFLLYLRIIWLRFKIRISGLFPKKKNDVDLFIYEDDK